MRRRVVASLIAAAALAPCGALCASTPTDWDTALPGINPDMLSGGVYASFSEMLGKGTRTERATLFPGATAYPVVLDPRSGANVQVGADPPQLPVDGTQQAEPHVVRSAVDPDYLVATFQEGRFGTVGGARSNGYGVSRDGGLTWTRALIPSLTTVNGGPYFRATDPVAGLDRAGNIYLNSLVAVDSAFNLGAIVINKSTDGGATFGAPLIVFQAPNTLTFPDKNWMAVNDLPGTFSTGRVLVTWTNFTRNAQGQTTGTNLVSRTSDDGGATWGTVANITPAGSSNQGTLPMFFPDGTAGVAYITFLSSTDLRQIRIQYQHSNDGGRTWPGPERAVATVTGWDDPTMRDGIFLPTAACSRTSGRVVIAMSLVIGGGPKIVCFTSADRGATWSGPFVVADPGVNGSVLNPAIAISEDGMEVSVIFYQKDISSAPDMVNFVNIMAAHSFDGGTSWGTPVRVTDVSTDIRFGQFTDRGYMLGDYQGLTHPAGPDAPPVALWIDTRTGNADPFSARVVPSNARDFSAWRRAQFSSTALTDPAAVAPDGDPDEDGLPNGIEYAMPTNPTKADFATPFGYRRSSSPQGPQLVLSYPRRAFNQDVHLEWDRSADGVNWTPIVPTGVSVGAIRPDYPSGSLVTSHLPFDGLPDPSFRLRATIGGIQAPATRTFSNACDARLVNVSTRGNVGTGDNILIGGFYIAGSAQKQVLIRGAGPALENLILTEPLEDPRLDLFRAGESVPFASNDDWSVPSGGAITTAAARTGAFEWTEGSSDAALLSTPGIGGYTAQIKGTADGTGVALVEVYDANTEVTEGRLTNLSTRGHVGTGEQILIAGFFINGTEPKLVLVRAVGPTLADYIFTTPLADPRLEIYRVGEPVPIARIDDWEHTINPFALRDAALLSGAFALPDGSRDAALLLHLPPGGYTAQVIGVGGATGVALVEVYEVN